MMRAAGTCAAALALASCDRAAAPRSGDPPVVMLAVGLGGGATVQGSATSAPARQAAGAPALAKALYDCEQRRFTVIDLETVEFPSSTLDSDMVDCVASHVAFPFEAVVIGEQGGEFLARPVRRPQSDQRVGTDASPE
jgi:hypothetical protein